MGLTRRRFLIGAGVAGAALVGLRTAVPWWLRPGPVREPVGDARALVDEAFRGLDRSRVWDSHVHLLGAPEGGNGCWVNPRMRSHLHPILRLQFDAYTSASGITDPELADIQYVERLLALHRGFNPDGRLVILAFDFRVGRDGREDRERSIFHVPDARVLELARLYPDVFVPCASIHPYRPDAVERLDRAVEGGAAAVKWLPNAMGIDPASPRCDRFYRRLAEHRVPLITHTGKELAVRSEQHELGNPLRVRRALDRGVKVVLAHCGDTGTARDLDRGGENGPDVPAFDLFLRMMRAPGHGGSLWGDVSGAAFVNHVGRPLGELLRAGDLHGRLVHGSDYPLPAIGTMTSPWLLARQGWIEGSDRSALGALFEANPILYDFVLKRRLRFREEGGREHRFADRVFESARLFR